MIVRKPFTPPWEKKRNKSRISFDDALTHLGANGEFINAREIKEPLSYPTVKR